MVQYTDSRLDASFAALSDATRRGVLEQLDHQRTVRKAAASDFTHHERVGEYACILEQRPEPRISAAQRILVAREVLQRRPDQPQRLRHRNQVAMV